MAHTIELSTSGRNLFGTPGPLDRFAAIDAGSAEGRTVLASIARKIAATRRPRARSAIPAGATYLAQFVAHDLDYAGAGRLDLGLIYGEGPKRDAVCYQVPQAPGACRHLLRLGRTRTTDASPAWGPARDLPRTGCPHLDSRPGVGRSEVLVPNALSDSNALLGQIQVLWTLTHNALAATLAPAHGPEAAWALARRINRGIYRDVVRHDLLGTWLMPRLRDRYAAGEPQRLDAAPRDGTPREFLAGVGRLGHGLVREIYALNDRSEVVGLRDLMRHTSTGRPHEMPLTGEWLVDFSRFFAIGASVPQRARALGPHVARALATGVGSAEETADGGLVLRDLAACCGAGLRSVRSLVARVEAAEPGLLDGAFAGDPARWRAALADWLADTGLAPDEIERLAGDPPLVLFLMLEAEADTGGRWLGALGSVIMGETLAAALPAADAAPELEAARRTVFRGQAPATVAELVRFLQRHFRFPDGVRLHRAERSNDQPVPTLDPTGGQTMLDIQAVARQPLPRIDVADYIEMGRLVAQWVTEPETRPTDVDDLRRQLDGVAVVPPSIKSFEFAQSTLDHLVLRLPPREIIEEGIERMTDPMTDGRYPLPQFYADHYRPGFGPVMTPLDTLLARVGDQTIAQGR
jgi:hypothetical protein